MEQRTENSSTTPPIGLALGGGVARGWSHIGVLQRLDELGIKPQIVCGTSVGALVSGFWLAGELDELERWARSLTKRRMLSYVDIVFNGAGLMGGRRLEKAIEKYLPPVQIEDLPVKFAAVTSELATGHEIWLTEGDLRNALQASYALPGVFPPRAVNNRWLIDGALVNPLPVSVCRAMGARVVIAVGLHADSFAQNALHRLEKFSLTAEEMTEDDDDKLAPLSVTKKLILNRFLSHSDTSPGVGSVVLASFNILMDRITRSRLAGDPADVLLQPATGNFGLLDFDRADELITIGRDTVDAHIPEIERAMQMLGT